MKSTPSAVINSEYLVSCWKLQRTDGTVLGFTSHDNDLVIDTITYQAASGFSRTATRQTSDLKADNQDVYGIFDSSAITDSDLAAGLYEGAKVWHFEVDWTDPTLGKHKLDAGIIGPVTRMRNSFTATFLNLESLLSQTIGRKYNRSCNHTLGDSSCGIELEPIDWQATETVDLLDVRVSTSYDGRRYVCTTAGTTGGTEPTWDITMGNTTSDGTVIWTAYDSYVKEGSVTAITDNQIFLDGARTEADGDFNYGWVEWLTGDNVGLRMAVKSYIYSTSTISLMFPMPFDIQVGDTYKITRGCNKQLKLSGDTWGTAYTGDCRAKFNLEDGGNALNYGGFPEIPGSDKITSGA